MQEFRVGSLIDEKYRVLSLLGSGGLGTVYKAEHAELSRIVAVKILRVDGLLSTDSKSRFEREARILASLKNQNIVSVYSFGLLDESHPYMVMECLEGTTLADELNKSGSMPWRRAVKIAMQICSAVQFAHQQGIIHRDLKPQNVILLQQSEADFVKVLDFGLSRITHASGEQAPQKLTQTGTLIGSIHYMAPELCTGNKANERSDIYALACIMYEMLAGKVPFDGENPMSILHKHVNSTAEKLADTVPVELQQIIFKALQKEPNNRFNSMDELLSTLKLLNSGALSINDVEVKEQKKKSKKSSLLIPVAVLATIAIGSLSVYSLQRKSVPEPVSKKNAATEARKNASAKTEQLIQLSESLVKSGRIPQANTYLERAVKLLSHAYSAEAVTPELCQKDLELVRRITVLSAQTKPRFVDFYHGQNKIRSSTYALSFPDTIKLNEYLLEIERNTGSYNESLQSQLELVELVLETGRVDLAKKSFEKQRLIFEKLDMPSEIVNLYLHLIAARISAFEKKFGSANQDLAIVEKNISALDALNVLQRSTVLITLMVVYAEVGNKPMFEHYSLVAKQQAIEMINPHMDRLNTYYYELFSIYTKNFVDLSKAKQVIADWQSYMDSLDKSRRQERLEQSLVKARATLAEIENAKSDDSHSHNQLK